MALPWDLYAKGLIPFGYGHPLWFPEPSPDSGEVHLGDVGYLRDGAFSFLFSTMRSADDPANVVRGVPDDFDIFAPSNPMLVFRQDEITQQHLHSKSLQSIATSTGASASELGVSAGAGLRYSCSQQSGAWLMLKEPAHRTYLDCKVHIQKYIRRHIASWCNFANNVLGIGLEEKDIIFVSGFTKSSVWAEAAFYNSSASGELVIAGGCFVPSVSGEFRVSLARSMDASVFHRMGPRKRVLDWRDDGTPSPADGFDQCLFLHYYKMKHRRLWKSIAMRAAAGFHDLGGDDENDAEDGTDRSPIQLTADDFVDDDQSENREETFDPVNCLLDYILEYSEAEVACADERDLYHVLKGRDIPDNFVALLETLSPEILVDEDGVGSIKTHASISCDVNYLPKAPGTSSLSGLPSSDEVASPSSPQRSTSVVPLPDPSQFPDPYPYWRPSQWHIGTNAPSLSSAESSSASTRSSAYTWSAESGDYDHVHVVYEDDESGVGLGITADDVTQLPVKESGVTAMSRYPVSQMRWSDFYQKSQANSEAEEALPPLRASSCLEIGWKHPDERDEVGLSSNVCDGTSSDDHENDERGKEPSSLVLLAGTGSAVIVRPAEDTPLVRLHDPQGTTHLMLGSSSTPNAMPSFLSTTLPQICSSLLCLDVSNNVLSSLPPSLAMCVKLEELNIASNPLRTVPAFLATLTDLRVLMVDATGISTLPSGLASLEKLHTLSIRRNKMHSLPSWLCVLPALETLLVDGNPFQGPWKALVEPLIIRMPPKKYTSSVFSPAPLSPTVGRRTFPLNDTASWDSSPTKPIALATGSNQDAEKAAVHIPNTQQDEEESAHETHIHALRPVMSYLRDMYHLSQLQSQLSEVVTVWPDRQKSNEDKVYEDDEAKRVEVIREVIETERTYVMGLQELVDIYIKPALATTYTLSGVASSKDTVVPAQERKIVFGGVEALFVFHQQIFLPALERAASPIMSRSPSEINRQLSMNVARDVANTFVSHAAFMKMYSTYINNFDDAVEHIKMWTSDKVVMTSGMQSPSPSSNIPFRRSKASALSHGHTRLPTSMPLNHATITASQRKSIKAYLKRCQMNPRHSQLNLEGYLMLPLQRIPRYRLLLEELARSSPPSNAYPDNLIERALTEIASLATNMHEGKRDAESRRRLVQWQSRICGKFPSPLVQPFRRLILDGSLQLTRVVRKATMAFEVIDAQGDASSVEVECLSPELTPRSLIGILCNDLLVLCRDPSDGQDPHCSVDLWAVLRMQTLPQPASIVHGNALRLVDNKAILYFDAPSTSEAMAWCQAINLEIPASHRGRVES